MDKLHLNNMDIKNYISASILILTVAAVSYAVISSQSKSNERKRVTAEKEAEIRAKVYSDGQKAKRLRAKIKAWEDAEKAEELKKLESKYKCSGPSCYSVCSIPDMEGWLAKDNSYEACSYVFNLKPTYYNFYQKQIWERAIRRGAQRR